ncbi:hypothetical protein GCM10023339_16750 [Alloalcanivorax gelatiniphagus]
MRKVIGGLLALGVAAAAVPAAEAETIGAAMRCAGRTATIVSDDREVAGTPGADVIVVRARRAEVDAGAGDDRICVRGRGGYIFVEAGAGNDRIEVEARTYAYAALGAGRDTYVGGAGTDTVVSGVPGDVNRDRIRLAGGADVVSLEQGADHRGAVLVGGAGHDQLRLQVREGALHVDSAAQLATHRGAPYATWRSFEAHAMYSAGAQLFTGSEGDDEVHFGGWGAVTATTLGGDDAVHLSVEADVPTSAVPQGARSSARTPASRITLDLGLGRDELGLTSWDALVRADLALARVELSSGADTTGSFGFAGVEDLAVRAETTSRRDSPTRVVLVGDDQDNRLQADGCRVELAGGGGDDHLRVGFPPPDSFLVVGGQQPKTCRRSSAVGGGTGDDVLASRAMDLDLSGVDIEDLEGGGDVVRVIEVPVRDVFDGGEGHDTADAGKGTDSCVAEVRVDCES